jgi:hypothetical protein
MNTPLAAPPLSHPRTSLGRFALTADELGLIHQAVKDGRALLVSGTILNGADDLVGALAVLSAAAVVVNMRHAEVTDLSLAAKAGATLVVVGVPDLARSRELWSERWMTQQSADEARWPVAVQPIWDGDRRLVVTDLRVDPNDAHDVPDRHSAQRTVRYTLAGSVDARP